jgi:hypothetical protein
MRDITPFEQFKKCSKKRYLSLHSLVNISHCTLCRVLQIHDIIEENSRKKKKTFLRSTLRARLSFIAHFDEHFISLIEHFEKVNKKH